MACVHYIYHKIYLGKSCGEIPNSEDKKATNSAYFKPPPTTISPRTCDGPRNECPSYNIYVMKTKIIIRANQFSIRCGKGSRSPPYCDTFDWPNKATAEAIMGAERAPSHGFLVAQVQPIVSARVKRVFLHLPEDHICAILCMLLTLAMFNIIHAIQSTGRLAAVSSLPSFTKPPLSPHTGRTEVKPPSIIRAV